MNAISMMQPYAWLFARGILQIDDRQWSTPIRGSVAIHASRKFNARYHEIFQEVTGLTIPGEGDYEYGGVVGVAELVDVLPANLNSDKDYPKIRRSHFGHVGFNGLVFENARVVDFIKTPGQLGIFQIFCHNL